MRLKAVPISTPYTWPMTKMLAGVEHVYSYVRIISLDVAAAALAGGILATLVIGSVPRSSFYWLLPTGVWVAYTVDHLLDAQRMGPNARSPRHRFHHRHARALWTCVGIASVICAIGGWLSLTWFGLIYAGVMCGLVIIHETIIKLTGSRVSPLLVKELGVAVVFTAGVWGMPWLRHYLDSGRVFGWPWMILLQYFLLAAVNLIEFSIYEVKNDRADGQTSFVRGVGRPIARRIVWGLLILQLPLCSLAFWQSSGWIIINVETILLLMAVGLLTVIAMPRAMLRAERYRTLGDGVFLLPLILLVCR